MKKYILILFLFCSAICFGQGYPLPQTIGSPNTIVSVPSPGALQGVLINRNFSDTSAANATPADFYPGCFIFTSSDTSVWVRSVGAHKWIKVVGSTGGGGVTTNIYTADGTLTGNRTLSGGGSDLEFTGLQDFRVPDATGDIILGTAIDNRIRLSTGLSALTAIDADSFYLTRLPRSQGNTTDSVLVRTSDLKIKTRSIGSLGRMYYLTENGCVSDARVYQTSQTFGTDNTAAIQAICNLASPTNPIVIVCDGQFSTSGIDVKGNTTIWTPFPGDGFILRNGANRPLIRNYNKSFNPASRVDSSIYIIGGIYNGNYTGQTDLGNPTYGLVTAMQWIGVYDLHLQGFNINDHKTYAIAAWNIKNYYARDFIIDYTTGTNTDGIHADGNCENVWFENATIRAGDDAVAMNADDNYTNLITHYTYPYYVNSQGPVTDVYINNIKLNGGVFGIRILSTVSRVDNIFIKNLSGTTAIKWFESDLAGITSVSGNIGTVTFEDIHVKCTTSGADQFCANIKGSFDNLTFRNVTRDFFTSAAPTFYIGQAGYVKNLTIDNYIGIDTSDNVVNHIYFDNGGVTSMTVSNSRVSKRTLDSSVFIKVNGGAVNRLRLNNVEGDNVVHIAELQSGIMDYVSAVGIVHTGVQADSSATFQIDSSKQVLDMDLSNYYGWNPGPGDPDGSFVKSRGDGFQALPDTVVDISEVYVDLDFSENMFGSGVLQQTANVWTTTSLDGVYGHKGETDAFLPGQRNGGLKMYADASAATPTGGGCKIGFNADGAAPITPFIYAGFEFIGGNVTRYDGASVNVVEPVTATYWYRIIKDASTKRFYLQKSPTENGTYTTIYSYNVTWGSNLWPMCDLGGNAALYQLYYPKGSGLTR